MTRPARLRIGTPAALVVALALVPAAGSAQRVQTAVVPEAITVGDVFHAAIRIDAPPGTELLAPDSLALPDDVEHAARREFRSDSAGGVRTVTAVYALSAWRPGSYELPPVMLRLVTPQGERLVEARLPAFTVRSVLPADTAGITMRAQKDVLGADRIWWPWLLLALLLAAAAALAWWWWRRHRRTAEPEVVDVPAVPARDVALQRLAALQASGLAERGEWRQYYGELAAALRHYAPSVDDEWSVDPTTSELAHLARGRTDIGVLELIRVLAAADLVKFARARPAAAGAAADLAAAREWVERTSTPAPVEDSAGEHRRVA
jgi:hypothetical protein